MDSQATVAAQTVLQVQRLVSPLPPPQLEFDCDVALADPRASSLLSSLESSTAGLIHDLRVRQTSRASTAGLPSSDAPLERGIFRGFQDPRLRVDFPLASAAGEPDFINEVSGVLDLLSHPEVALRLYAASNSTPSYSLPDLYAAFRRTCVAEASYYPDEKKLLCRWRFATPAGGLLTTPKLFSVPDLAFSSFRLEMTNSPSSYATFIQPRRVKLIFGSVTLAVTNFSELPHAYSHNIRMSQQELATRWPGIPAAALAEQEDPDYNPSGIVACRGTFPGLNEITTASDPILVPRVIPPLPPFNLKIMEVH